ncbi:MAG: carboxypeptidase M32 [Lachnospiraceae bacterium]|nr:carboxypeptidase M32 [Lachnospiraceae bacterium]
MREKLQNLIDRLAAYGAAAVVMDWDISTGSAPEEAGEYTAKLLGILAGESFTLSTCEDTVTLLKECKANPSEDEVERAIVDRLWEEYEQIHSIPRKEYQEYHELTSKGMRVWEKAKEAKDFSRFAPVLEQLINKTKKIKGYQPRKEGHSLYDMMLDGYEKGFTTAELDCFFDGLKKELLPLVRAISEKQDAVRTDFLSRSCDVEKQKAFNRLLSEYLGFNLNRGVIAESEHPFTTALHNHDVRITSHYYEDMVISGIFSTIHETGHALFEQNNSDRITMTPLAGGSCAVHESQSRMFENMIGRSEAFWEPLYPKFKEMFPEQFDDISLDVFVRGINAAAPSLIRTESDELTYCFHIMIRYELEKLMFDGEVSVEELPKLWNRKYKEYLGVEPADDAEGILQDVHWSGGMFGYFPSYALGNAIAAQIYHTMEKTVDIEGSLKAGDLKPIREFLREHIHQYGTMRETKKLLLDATGEEFNPDYYISYLKDKYAELYQL